MNCSQCGLPTNPGQKFCARCGSPLLTNLDAPPSRTAAAVAPLPTPNAPITGPLYQYASQVALAPAARTRSRAPLFAAIGAALVLITILVFTLLLTTRTTTIDDQIAPRDPELALKQAATTMASVKTLHYKSEVGFFGIDSDTTGITDTSPLTITLNGVIALPDSFTLNANITQLGHYIAIGDNTWKRVSGGDPWTQQSTGDSSLGLINPLTFTSYLTYVMTGTAQTISQEGQGENVLQRVRFKVDVARMAASTRDPSTRSTLSGSRTINVDAWVGKDNRIARMTLSVEMESGAGIILRTTFSGYNDKVNIEPPQ